MAQWDRHSILSDLIVIIHRFLFEVVRVLMSRTLALEAFTITFSPTRQSMKSCGSKILFWRSGESVLPVKKNDFLKN